MKAIRIVMTSAAALALVAGGTAAGAAAAGTPGGPVDGSGGIHGCYSNQASHGAHVVKLQNAGTSCPPGTTAISWNKKGPAGPPGPRGRKGANGNTVLNGTGAPPSGLGSAGDFYIDTAASVLYGPKTASGWPATGTSLVGPPGPSGPTCSAPGPGANLAECSFSSLTGDLTGADLTSASLISANVANANLTGADLTGANLTNATVGNVNLTAVNLTGANLAGASVRGSTITDIIWVNTTCPDGTNSDSDGGTCEGHGL